MPPKWLGDRLKNLTTTYLSLGLHQEIPIPHAEIDDMFEAEMLDRYRDGLKERASHTPSSTLHQQPTGDDSNSRED